MELYIHKTNIFLVFFYKVIYIIFRYGTNSNFSLYNGDYVTLYVDIIQTIVQQEDPSRPYVISSPSNGANESAALGYVDPNPYDSRYGDGNNLFLKYFFITVCISLSLN